MGFLKGLFVLFAISVVLAYTEVDIEEDQLTDNYSVMDSDVISHASTEAQHANSEIIAQILVAETKNDTNVSHLKTAAMSKDWSDWNPQLKFPNTNLDKEYRVTKLHLDKGIFVFTFLRKFLSYIQPYDVPIDLVIEITENRINKSKIISEFLRLEATLLAVVGVCCILCCVMPGIELWLACRPIREDYQPNRHPNVLTSLLVIVLCILGIGIITMTVCNETVSASIEKFPAVIEAILQDLNDYHSSTTKRLRKWLSRSLDLASEAILADLDNIEDLLGKPIQAELISETGLDTVIDALIDTANGSQRILHNVESLLQDGENIRHLGNQLNKEIEDLHRNLEGALKACTGHDRPLCNIIDTSGLEFTFRIDKFVRDDRLVHLRDFKRENFTETIRQARGEYLYIPQHIARNSLEIQNEIRREVNKMRARVFDGARNMEASSFDLGKQIDFTRSLVSYATPHIMISEQIRWLTGIATVLSALLVWLLLFGGLCCRCNVEHKVRPILLCGIFIACFVSIILWIVFIATLVLSSNTEMLICRPLHDENYNILETILETQSFLGKKVGVPLKDLFKKCQEDEPAYPIFGLGNPIKLEQLTTYWTWSSISRITLKRKIELKTLKIFSPYLQRQLETLLYASGLNITELRAMIQGRLLSKDLEALSDQLESVVGQMNDKVTARSLETIVAIMQDILTRRLRPLMKLQDVLLYKLTVVELQVQLLQRQINHSLAHVKTIQHYIDHQGDKIVQLKMKRYMDRLANYLDQWRSHILSEMGNGLIKCRPVWDIIESLRLLLCNHFLDNLNGYCFSTFLCAVIMILGIPVAHILSLVYKKVSTAAKDANIQSTILEEVQPASSEGGTWNTPEPPPPASEGD